jgi:predicted nuclease of predicted toxin-antitoxin system
MKFIVDVGVGKIVERWLIENNYDIKSVIDINPRMADVEILSIANSEQRIVITMDKDFGELVFNGKHSMYGVLLLRLEGATGLEKLHIIQEIFNNYKEELPLHFSVYQNQKLRIKPLKKT